MNIESEKIIELGYKLSGETVFGVETCIYVLGSVLRKRNYLTLEELYEESLKQLRAKAIAALSR